MKEEIGQMIRFKMIQHLVGTALLSAVLPLELHASDQWKLILELQLRKEKYCEVVRLTSIQTSELLGVTSIRADAHCRDGRVYTVVRDGTHEKFKITQCPTRC
jgi:hypothetical protein